MKTSYLALAIVTASFAAQSQSLLDNFNGSTVDSSIWNVVLPFSQSQVSESGGYFTTTGRGTLETVAGFNSPYTVSGAVTLNSSLEHFSVTLRSDLQPGYQSTDGRQYYELTGLKAVFSMDGGEISLQEFTPTSATILADVSYSLSVGQTYDFSITDTGSSISLAVNGSDLLSATTGYSTGDQIAFQSREFNDTSSSLDFVEIAAVPEPSSLAMVAVGLVGLFGFRRLTVWSNKSPTAVGACSSAVAVHVASRRWLSFFR